MKRIWLAAAVVLVLPLVACGGDDDDGPADNTESLQVQATGPMVFTSAAFPSGGEIPADYTCDGAAGSPPLTWGDVPDGTESLALEMIDRDAGGFVHWLMYEIPMDVLTLPPGVPRDETLDFGAKQGKNSFGDIGYGGPCPPSGSHEYVFRLYALDTAVGLESGAEQDAFAAAIDGHVLALSELAATYGE